MQTRESVNMPGRFQPKTVAARKGDAAKAQKRETVTKQTASKSHARTAADRASQSHGGGNHNDVTLVIESPVAAPRRMENPPNNIETAMNNIVQEAQRRARSDEGKVEMRRMAHLLKRAASTILDNVGEGSDHSDHGDSTASGSDSDESVNSGSECSCCQGRSSSSASAECSDSECDCSDCLLDSEYTLESDD